MYLFIWPTHFSCGVEWSGEQTEVNPGKYDHLIKVVLNYKQFALL